MEESALACPSGIGRGNSGYGLGCSSWIVCRVLRLAFALRDWRGVCGRGGLLRDGVRDWQSRDDGVGDWSNRGGGAEDWLNRVASVVEDLQVGCRDDGGEFLLSSREWATLV